MSRTIHCLMDNKHQHGDDAKFWDYATQTEGTQRLYSGNKSSIKRPNNNNNNNNKLHGETRQGIPRILRKVHQSLSPSQFLKIRFNIIFDFTSAQTRYGLDSPGIQSRCGRYFPHPSKPALGPTQTPIQWTPDLFPGCKGAGAWPWPSTRFHSKVKERAVQ